MILEISEVVSNVYFKKDKLLLKGKASMRKNGYIFSVEFLHGKYIEKENDFLEIKKINGIELENKKTILSEEIKKELADYIKNGCNIGKKMEEIRKKIIDSFQELTEKGNFDIINTSYFDEEAQIEVEINNGCGFEFFLPTYSDVIIIGGVNVIMDNNVKVKLKIRKTFRYNIEPEKYSKLTNNLIKNILNNKKEVNFNVFDFLENAKLKVDEEYKENIRMLLEKEIEKDKKNRLKILTGVKYSKIKELYF